MNGGSSEDIARELDELHREARESFQDRDVAGYMAVFAPDLKYRQANGLVIGRDELARDVAAQLAAVESAETSYVREWLHLEDGQAIELLAQRARVTLRRFLIFSSVVRVERRGRYVWSRTADGWKIIEVEILEERVAPEGG